MSKPKGRSRRARDKFHIDPAHNAIDLFGQPITRDVWREKYSLPTEQHPHESMRRVVEGVYRLDSAEHGRDALEAMTKGLWVPGGRIHAGAGTSRVVTLHNCYVLRYMDDSMADIAATLSDAMLTMQQGGGIGTDFSTLRPSGAYLSRTDAVASGPLPFMHTWDAMCATIMSAGSRRGAMMGTLRDDHPDLPKFIEAKHQAGKLTNFNVSVLVSDAFMDAVAQDEDWMLGFGIPRADGKHVAIVERDEGPWYVYSTMKARVLWDMIIRSTYEYSEPGVIFIDRINEHNNLNYCETISCTNPCGEQPLPPNGACNLGAVNLARMVRDPFGQNPKFDFALLRQIVRVGMRFLDNVIDISGYPLGEQRQEQVNKRRTGLGITGLGNALAEMKIRYGSEASLHFTETVMEQLCETAYEASVELAKERGPFPLFDAAHWGHTPVVENLPRKLREDISKHGIRNGMLLTIAPTGTTSLYMGNVSSGLEPVFLHKVRRKVRQPDGTFEEYDALDYGYNLFTSIHGNLQIWPDYLVTHEHLTVKDHVRMQAVCQRYIDASVSKTINCPEDISFEDFKLVYYDAYNLGCKGCTTYKPSEVRGSILSDGKKAKKVAPARQRPDALRGTTYRVRWPNTDGSYYITINEDLEGKPFEMFIASTNSKYGDWTTALSLMVSAIMRLGYDISFVPEELRKVSSHHDQAWIDGQHYGSLVALIGDILGKHLLKDVEIIEGSVGEIESPTDLFDMPLEICPKCDRYTLFRQEGCKICSSCNYSSCG